MLKNSYTKIAEWYVLLASVHGSQTGLPSSYISVWQSEGL